jgi:hypothetical protein
MCCRNVVFPIQNLAEPPLKKRMALEGHGIPVSGLPAGSGSRLYLPTGEHFITKRFRRRTHHTWGSARQVRPARPHRRAGPGQPGKEIVDLLTRQDLTLDDPSRDRLIKKVGDRYRGVRRLGPRSALPGGGHARHAGRCRLREPVALREGTGEGARDDERAAAAVLREGAAALQGQAPEGRPAAGIPIKNFPRDIPPENLFFHGDPFSFGTAIPVPQDLREFMRITVPTLSAVRNIM